MMEPMSDNDLRALERRVNEKFVAASAARLPPWDLPGDPFDCADWFTTTDTPGSVNVPQFPREQWASYPAKRTVTLLLCDRLLDNADELTEEQWGTLCFAMQYGGKTRLT